MEVTICSKVFRTVGSCLYCGGSVLGESVVGDFAVYTKFLTIATPTTMKSMLETSYICTLILLLHENNPV